MAPPRIALIWAVFSVVAFFCGLSQATPSIQMEYCARVNTGAKFDPFVSEFQSMGRCKINCTDIDYSFAIVLEKRCWCSNVVPNEADQNSLSDCTYPCPGYPDDICGGKGVWGYLEIPQNKPTATAPPGIFTTSRQPSKTASPDQAVTSDGSTVETVTVGGVVKTVTAALPQATGGTVPSSSNGLQAGAVAGIAVGIIGGLSVLGLFVWLLWKKRRQEEQQGFVSPMRGGSASGMASIGSKAPHVTEQPLSWEAKRRSQLMPIDPRLDPFYVRDPNRSRDSINSLQDNHDYSRRLDAPRVLRATNPDPDY
ncbi:hypothetical protein QBC41DRAFT_119079 [Cercophora samala]|uniref:WSC domain-containing protein n=1 Tax=Cercophora samala TaxID=330535 RepID=A0AA39ZD26_9PEZI|nr:hypothetical protein QBC41DRAFT_119079 [Cercophora samala]